MVYLVQVQAHSVQDHLLEDLLDKIMVLRLVELLVTHLLEVSTLSAPLSDKQDILPMGLEAPSALHHQALSPVTEPEALDPWVDLEALVSASDP